MPALPLPLIVSLLLAFLLVQAAVQGSVPRWLRALLAACALQGVVISLNQYYGLAGFALIQPVTATIIPPLAWVAFQAVAVRGLTPGRDGIHSLAPIFTAFCVIFAREVLDQVVLLVFVGYGAALLFALRRGRDTLLLTRLESGETPLRIWRVIGVALILSGLSDGLIVLAQIAGQGQLQPVIIGVFTSATLLALGVLGLSQSLDGDKPDPAPTDTAEPPPYDPEEDAVLMARLAALLAERPLYLDPGLSLGQLARRLHLPAKTLSAAINRAKGENVSRLINSYRIDHACTLLAKGETVTEAMLASGFNTKSNFNREFLRVKGCAPSDWRAETCQDVVDKPPLTP